MARKKELAEAEATLDGLLASTRCGGGVGHGRRASARAAAAGGLLRAVLPGRTARARCPSGSAWGARARLARPGTAAHRERTREGGGSKGRGGLGLRSHAGPPIPGRDVSGTHRTARPARCRDRDAVRRIRR